MTFKASNAVPSRAYNEIKLEALKVKDFADRVVILLSSDFSANNLNGMITTLIHHKAKLDNLKATAGLSQYAKDQESDQSYDVVAEFAALLSLIDTVIAEIKNTPTNSLISGWGANGVIWNTFNISATAPLKSSFQDLSNGVS